MLPESAPFFEKLQTAQWQPIRDNLIRLVPFGSSSTIQQLGHSATLHDVFEHDDTSGTLWRVREESDTLKAHFPQQGDVPECGIVPLTSMITLLAVKNNRTSFRCAIGEPLLAGDVILIAQSGIQLIKKNGSEGVVLVESQELQSGDTTLGKNLRIPSNTTLVKQESIELPQGAGFQFVTTAQTSPWHAFFTGTYRIPTTFEKGNSHKIPMFDIGILPEIVAQTGAAVGKNLLSDGRIFVYEWGVFNFDDTIELMEGESLRTTAQLTRNEGGKISYLFCLRRSRDDKELLWWQVDAASIEYERMTRLTQILRQKRAKVKKVEN